jgi:hypothetical protein
VILRTLFLLAMLQCRLLCAAEGQWDTTDYALAGTALTALLIDWGQSRHIAKNPERYYETNGLLGRNPSPGRVNAYFIGSMLTTVLVADYLSGPMRKAFLGGLIVMEYEVVTRNRAIGIRIQF